MRVLYLTFFETPIRNGIYETQVHQVLCGLAQKYAQKMKLNHVAFLPALVVGRSGVSPESIFGKEYENVRDRFVKCNVRANFIFVPLVLPKRWKSCLGVTLLTLSLIVSIPIVTFWIYRNKPEVIHCRSYVSTLLAIVACRVWGNAKVIFDPRGFYPEEGVVTGRWSEESFTFKMWKGVERLLYKNSDAVVALSDSFAERIALMANEAKRVTIYAGADIGRFKKSLISRRNIREKLKVEERTVFVYSGALGAWHDPDLLGKLFSTIVQALPNSFLLVLTGYDRGELVSILQRNGLGHEDFAIHSAQSRDIPDYLAACDFGFVPATVGSNGGPMSVIAQTMIGTKVAEYLATGLPIIVNNNVGGLKSLMARHKIGIQFDGNDFSGVVSGIKSLMDTYEECQRACRLVAERYFSLDQAVASYFHLYSDLTKR